MRKLMLLAAMLAMVLVAAAPAMAQATVISNDSDGFDDDNFGLFDDDFDNSSTVVLNASQTQVADVSQVNTGDANAVADDGSVAVATVDQELFVEQDATQQVVASGFGFDGDLDNDGILDDFEVFDNDLDDDGILDAFDFIILFGDFDNDGIQDQFE
jgi:hypothetical protein